MTGGFLSELQRTEPQLSRQLQQAVMYLNTKDSALPVYRLARGLQTLTTRSRHALMAVNA
jgi:hypothetical protein